MNRVHRLRVALALAILALVPAAGSSQAEDVTRTIHVPAGWEGAYEFGYAPVLRVGDTVIVSGIAAGGEGTYEADQNLHVQSAALGGTIPRHREPRTS